MPKFQDGQIVRHVKTGVEYRIFAGPDRAKNEATGWCVYIYRERSNPLGTLWVRARESMEEDGRFEVVP